MNVPNHVIAHRGVFDNVRIPENSLSAFQKAIDLHYNIELDVQLTKDSILVVFHDDTLERMCHDKRRVQNCTYQELQELSLLDTNEKIPTLKEVLNLVQDQVLLDIEVKNTKRVADTCDFLMEEVKPYHKYVIKSFSPKIIRYIKKKNSQIDVGYLIDKDYDNFWLRHLLPSRGMIAYSKADFLAIHKKLLNTRKFQSLKKKYPLFLWTIKKDDHYDSNEYVLICNDLME